MGVFPASWTIPFDTYYTAFFGNLLMFCVGYGIASALPHRERDPANPTMREPRS